MKTYRLSSKGRRVLKTTSREREPILDHLYENKTASLAELEAIDKDARAKLRTYASLVEEVQ